MITGKGAVQADRPGLRARVETRDRHVQVRGRRGRYVEHDVVDTRVGSALAFDIAWRSVPGPLSPVLLTTKVGRVRLLLVIVSVAELIAPKVAPPTGWPSVRLTVEKLVERLGFERIGIEKLSSVAVGGNVSVPATPV